MKKEYFKTADTYMSPKIDVLRISIEGLLCGSLGGGNSAGLGGDNDPFEDGGSVDLFFL
jgi:hypothetical protein